MNSEVTNETQMKQLKAIELDLLNIFIKSCEKLNLKYYVIGGTLLGAVRHQGFIPWDDDIDVAMPREDYEQWVRKAPDIINNDTYFVQSFLSEPNYLANFAKLRNSKTTFIEKSLRKLNINHGIYIDIFPLDYHSTKNKIFKLKQFFYTSKILSAYDMDAIDYPKYKKFLRQFAAIFVPGKPFEAVVKREKLYQSAKTGNFLANYNGAWGDKEIIPKEWYGDGTHLTFEGVDIIAPQKYSEWLTQVYGNYMELPPVEKRVTHHFTDVIDLNKSYKEYWGINK